MLSIQKRSCNNEDINNTPKYVHYHDWFFFMDVSVHIPDYVIDNQKAKKLNRYSISIFFAPNFVCLEASHEWTDNPHDIDQVVNKSFK